MKKALIVYPLCFLLLILLFFGSMWTVYRIPHEKLQENIDEANLLIDQEGSYPLYFFGSQASRLDNFTDRLMINTNRDVKKNDPLYNAMSNAGYSRYWHGYMTVLRPMLTLFSLQEIRYISTVAFFLLILAVFCKMQKMAGRLSALSFILMLSCLFILAVPTSLQFQSVFYILFISLLALLYLYPHLPERYIPLLFMTVGAVTNFFDLLTAPLLTMGVPLALYLLLSVRDGAPWLYCLRRILLNGFFWVLGYGLCWAAKWAIGGAITDTNIFQVAITAIFFRTSGNEDMPVDRLETVSDNFHIVFDYAPIYLTLIFAFTVLLVLAVLSHPAPKKLASSALFLPIVALPYMWFFVLANHSSLHVYFTYRIQGIAVFALALALVMLIDRERIGTSLLFLKQKCLAGWAWLKSRLPSREAN